MNSLRRKISQYAYCCLFKNNAMYIHITIFILLLCGCTCPKSQMTNTLNKMIGTQVKLCIPQMECKQASSKSNSNFKMIVYIDSTECTPCALSHLRYWNPLIKETKNIDINYIFIIAPKTKEIYDINVEMEITDLENSIYLDKKYVFLKNNKNIPKETMYHTFLLDMNNKVVIVGNPIGNKRVKNLFYKIIREYETKKN